MLRFLTLALGGMLVFFTNIYGTLNIEVANFKAMQPIINKSLAPNLRIITFEFNELQYTNASGNFSLENITLDSFFDTLEIDLVGKPYNFPNPFQLSGGTQIGYRLSRPTDIEIYIYTSFGHLITKLELPEYTNGGNAGYNKVDITDLEFGTLNVPAGIYFFLVTHNKKVLGKGKMAVIP